jgi:hypothetical protein
MGSCFLKRGTTYRVASQEALDMHDKLPAGTYAVKFSMETGFYLEVIDSFPIPSRIYGSYSQDADRIWNTFSKRTGTTGVLLTGEKGSGKTLLSKLVSHNALAQNVPTLVVNQPFSGEGFNTFLQDIEQRCIVIFDEFEKTYDKDDQEKILTLLDGVFNSTKLFILTSNDKWKIDVNMRNRPGRIFYLLEFRGVDEAFVRDYCHEKLNNKSYIQSICNLLTMFDAFNFDMLQSLVEEMNRYEESPQDALKFLNIKPLMIERQTYKIKFFIENSEIDEAKLEDTTVTISPMVSPVQVSWLTDKLDSDNEPEWENVIFTPEDIKHISQGKYLYVQGNYKLSISRIETDNFDYRKYL